MPSCGATLRRGVKARSAVSGSGVSKVSVGRLGSYRDAVRAGLHRGDAVAHGQQPARAGAQERVAAEALAAFDRFEEVRRTAVIEAEEGPDRRLEVGRARGAQEDRVGGTRQALRLAQAERIGCRHVRGLRAAPAPGNQNDLSSPGRKVEPSAVPPSFGDAALRDRRAALRRRSALPCIAGALRRSLLATGRSRRVRSGGSRVHSSSPSPRFPPATGSLCRRLDGYSSRSQPAIRLEPDSTRQRLRASSEGVGPPHRTRRHPRRASRAMRPRAPSRTRSWLGDVQMDERQLLDRHVRRPVGLVRPGGVVQGPLARWRSAPDRPGSAPPAARRTSPHAGSSSVPSAGCRRDRADSPEHALRAETRQDRLGLLDARDPARGRPRAKEAVTLREADREMERQAQ